MKTVKVIKSAYYSRIGEMTENKESKLFLSSIEKGALQTSIATGKNNFMIVISTVGNEERRYHNNIDINRIINRLKQRIKVGKGQRIEKLKAISDFTSKGIRVSEIKDNLSVPSFYGRRGISVQFKKRTRTKDKIKSLEIIHKKIGEIISIELQKRKIIIIPIITKKDTQRILQMTKNLYEKFRPMILSSLHLMICTAAILNIVTQKSKKTEYIDNRSITQPEE